MYNKQIGSINNDFEQCSNFKLVVLHVLCDYVTMLCAM